MESHHGELIIYSIAILYHVLPHTEKTCATFTFLQKTIYKLSKNIGFINIFSTDYKLDSTSRIIFTDKRDIFCSHCPRLPLLAKAVYGYLMFQSCANSQTREKRTWPNIIRLSKRCFTEQSYVFFDKHRDHSKKRFWDCIIVNGSS